MKGDVYKHVYETPHLKVSQNPLLRPSRDTISKMVDAEENFFQTLQLDEQMMGIDGERVVNDVDGEGVVDDVDGGGVVDDVNKTYVTFSVEQRIADLRNTTVYPESDDGVSTDVGEDFLMSMINTDKPHDNAPYKNNYKGATKSITKKQNKERVLKTFQYNPDDEDMQPGKRLTRKKGEDPDVHDMKKKAKVLQRNLLSARASRKKKAGEREHLEYMVKTMERDAIKTQEEVKNGQKEILRLENVLKTMTAISHNVLEDTNKAQEDAKNGQKNILRLENVVKTMTDVSNEDTNTAQKEIIRLLRMLNDFKGLHEAYNLLNDKYNNMEQVNKKLLEKLPSAVVQ
jgi:hypothetical protein